MRLFVTIDPKQLKFATGCNRYESEAVANRRNPQWNRRLIQERLERPPPQPGCHHFVEAFLSFLQKNARSAQIKSNFGEQNKGRRNCRFRIEERLVQCYLDPSTLEDEPSKLCVRKKPTIKSLLRENLGVKLTMFANWARILWLIQWGRTSPNTKSRHSGSLFLHTCSFLKRELRDPQTGNVPRYSDRRWVRFQPRARLPFNSDSHFAGDVYARTSLDPRQSVDR